VLSWRWLHAIPSWMTLLIEDDITRPITANRKPKQSHKICLLFIVRVTWLPIRPLSRGGRELTSKQSQKIHV
jgi:hypothetical protein